MLLIIAGKLLLIILDWNLPLQDISSRAAQLYDVPDDRKERTPRIFLRYAPESLRNGKFSKRSDVWSFGVTMYEIFSLGEDPKLPALELDRENGRGLDDEYCFKLLNALEQGARLPCPTTCPQEVYVKLMYPCWHLESHQRPDFATLCQDIQQLLNEY